MGSRLGVTWVEASDLGAKNTSQEREAAYRSVAERARYTRQCRHKQRTGNIHGKVSGVHHIRVNPGLFGLIENNGIECLARSQE